MKRIDAVVFDMDGVLIDSEPLWQRARAEFAADLGLPWNDADQAAMMGASTAVWSTLMCERLDLERRLGMGPAAVADAVIDRMSAKYTARLPERDGAIAAVHRIAAHWPVALATGSPQRLFEHVLRACGLDRVFRVAMTSDDVARGKPAPDVYLAVLARLGVDPERAVGIEDSGNGVRALAAAGMGIVAAPAPELPLSAEVRALSDVHIGAMGELDAACIERAAERRALRRA